MNRRWIWRKDYGIYFFNIFVLHFRPFPPGNPMYNSVYCCCFLPVDSFRSSIIRAKRESCEFVSDFEDEKRVAKS